jgi:flavin reductase (DIM6/NTAB) family NADH-FMN oxidoreductase RutF
VAAGDHVLALLRVEGVPVLDEGGRPLVRHRGRYTP